MQIVNYFRAKALHSSDAAFKLAMKNNKYIPFAEKMISVKNEKVRDEIKNTRYSPARHMLFENKVSRYEKFLGGIYRVRSLRCQNPDVLKYNNHLPRLEVVKNKDNTHEYFLPYNNPSQNIIITEAKDSSV